MSAPRHLADAPHAQHRRHQVLPARGVDPLSPCRRTVQGRNRLEPHRRARDVFQVVLSIQAGRITPSMLLRKLGTYNRHSLLYQAFREIGRAERTLFLLRFIAHTDIRRAIRAETTKI